MKPVLADQITNANALLAALNSKSRVSTDGGLTIRRPVMEAFNDTVASYSGYDPLNTTPQEGFGYAEYQWRQWAGSVTISGEEERKNAGGPQIINLLQAKIEQLRVSIEDVLNAQLWSDGSGNGGLDLLGLQAIVDDTVVLGGIDPSTDTWWKSVVGATIPDLTDVSGVKDLNHIYNSLFINRSKPDFEFTTQENFEAYEALASQNIRFTDTRMAELGFETVSHKNAAVVFEPDVPNDANTADDGGFWYFINSNHLEFVQHAQAWMKMLEWVRPYNQDARTSLIIGMGNLICDVRRAHGVIKETKVS